LPAFVGTNPLGYFHQLSKYPANYCFARKQIHTLPDHVKNTSDAQAATCSDLPWVSHGKSLTLVAENPSHPLSLARVPWREVHDSLRFSGITRIRRARRHFDARSEGERTHSYTQLQESLHFP
jgi:hypothetical protein